MDEMIEVAKNVTKLWLYVIEDAKIEYEHVCKHLKEESVRSKPPERLRCRRKQKKSLDELKHKRRLLRRYFVSDDFKLVCEFARTTPDEVLRTI